MQKKNNAQILYLFMTVMIVILNCVEMRDVKVGKIDHPMVITHENGAGETQKFLSAENRNAKNNQGTGMASTSKDCLKSMVIRPAFPFTVPNERWFT